VRKIVEYKDIKSNKDVVAIFDKDLDDKKKDI